MYLHCVAYSYSVKEKERRVQGQLSNKKLVKSTTTNRKKKGKKERKKNR